MSDKEITDGDEMLEVNLKEKSSILNISIVDLINRYVKRGLYTDDYYVPRQLTREELMEMSRKDVEEDKKRGIYPKKHNFDVFINRWSTDK